MSPAVMGVVLQSQGNGRGSSSPHGGTACRVLTECQACAMPLPWLGSPKAAAALWIQVQVVYSGGDPRSQSESEELRQRRAGS